MFLRALRDVADKAKGQVGAGTPGRRRARAATTGQADAPGPPRRAAGRGRRCSSAEQTVLLVYPGLLARYEQMDLLQRLRDKVGRPDGIPGLWMLMPPTSPPNCRCSTATPCP